MTKLQSSIIIAGMASEAVLVLAALVQHQLIALYAACAVTVLFAACIVTYMFGGSRHE